VRPADRAWLALAAGVVAWDVGCPRGELLSEASARYTKARPVLWPIVVAYVAGHLVHVWPTRCDPLSVLARSFGR
jgi:hypothetical protein